VRKGSADRLVRSNMWREGSEDDVIRESSHHRSIQSDRSTHAASCGAVGQTGGNTAMTVACLVGLHDDSYGAVLGDRPRSRSGGWILVCLTVRRDQSPPRPQRGSANAGLPPPLRSRGEQTTSSLDGSGVQVFSARRANGRCCSAATLPRAVKPVGLHFKARLGYPRRRQRGL